MKWEREDYFGNSVETAKKLIGSILVHETKEGVTAGRIVECEAYGDTYQGHEDDGAHSFKGLTERTKIIFGEGGYAYIYLIYGMYSCFNIVCGHEGEGTSVLIRALEPLEGIPLMQKRRKQTKLKLLTSGPGRLSMAMGIDRSLYGADLVNGSLYVLKKEKTYPIEQTKRINIDFAQYGKDFPCRFILKGNPYVTK